MIATKYINSNIPFLRPTDTVDDALMLLNDSKLNVLPYVNEGKFEGLYSEDFLLNYDTDFSLSEIQPLPLETVILENDPILEIIRKAHSIASDILPVVNLKGEYFGAIEKLEIYQTFIGNLTLYDVGGLLEINIKNKDYSLTEISRIIESESGKIISLFLTRDENDDLIISLKLDITHISSVISSLTRFGYEVVSYHSSEPINNIEKDRYELLMKYLSI